MDKLKYLALFLQNDQVVLSIFIYFLFYENWAKLLEDSAPCLFKTMVFYIGSRAWSDIDIKQSVQGI